MSIYYITKDNSETFEVFPCDPDYIKNETGKDIEELNPVVVTGFEGMVNYLIENIGSERSIGYVHVSRRVYRELTREEQQKLLHHFDNVYISLSSILRL